MTVQYLLWDFGDTLADERWIWPAPQGVVGWTDAYRAVASGPLGDRWNIGDAAVDDIAAAVGEHVDMTPDSVVAHIEARCRDISFFPGALAVARRATRPQALVTVNPDVFSKVVVPHYRLDDLFDVVVTSWQRHTADKTALADAATALLGGTDRGETLLIDNIAANCDAWRDAGGQAYWFRDDDEFGRHLEAAGWDGLALH